MALYSQLVRAPVEPVQKIDVMIVGAGPAGTSTWLHLQKFAPALAARAVLIEKTALPRDKLCAGGLGAWTEDVLRTLRIDLHIPWLSVPDIEFRYGHQHWVYRSFRPFRMVRRSDFDFALVKAAIGRGMRLHTNECFVAAHEGSDGLVVRTSRARYGVKALVGADGALSRVRRLMPASRGIGLAPTLQCSAPVDPRYDTEFDRRTMGLDLLPIDSGLQGYIWHCPCLHDGEPHMNHGIVDFRLNPGASAAGMKAALQRALTARHIDTAPRSWGSHPIRWFSPRAPISRPHVILAGDAAGIEPAFGGGIHMALSYGDLAAKALIQAFGDHDYSFRQYRQALNDHLLGRHINDYTRLARAMYRGEENPLDLVRRFFTHQPPQGDLLSLFLGLNRAH